MTMDNQQDETRPEVKVVQIDDYRRPPGRVVRNYDVVTEIINGTSVDHRIGLSGAEIHRLLRATVGDWPKRLGKKLFIIKDGEPKEIDSPPDFFGWLASENVTVDWADRCVAAISKAEFVAYLKMTVGAVSSLSGLPHFPRRDDCFYYGPDIPPGDEAVFDEFLSFFSPATAFDGLLLKAAFMTLFWGGGGGARPAFVISSNDDDMDGDAGRGVGKTTLTDLMGELAGGILEFGIGEKVEDVKKRLLTSRGERVVRFDNVKTSKYSSGDIEGLITAPYVSGHRLYTGNEALPNLFTYVFTFNDAMFSKDMAQRAVMIRLAKPAYDAEWKDRVESFLKNQRHAVLGGIGAAFARPTAKFSAVLRFAQWSGQVLSRVAPPEIVPWIKSRQAVVDDDSDLKDEVIQIVKHHLGKYTIPVAAFSGGSSGNDAVMVVRRSLLHRWVGEGLGLKGPVRGIKKMVARAHIPNLIGEHVIDGYDYYVWKPDAFTGTPKAGYRVVEHWREASHINEHAVEFRG